MRAITFSCGHDFLQRCAYCERPEAAVGGEAHCEIDHHRPVALFPQLGSEYTNLYYCCRDCNNRKANKCPTLEDEATDRRFSDPCAEDLYILHAVESGGGVLRWKTVCGRFTIDAIRLNREVLTSRRAKRAEMRDRVPRFEDLAAELRGPIVFRDAAARRMIQERIAMISGFVADARRLYGL
jgi:hypothetical protein